MDVDNQENKKIETEGDSIITVGKGEKHFIYNASAFILELIKLLILAGITIALVRYFLFKPFYVKGQSMEPNFLEKDYLIIDELTYRFQEPQRGQVVVFKSPLNNGDYYLKRIIGLPGERVKIDDNKVIIYNEANPQGMVVDEFYLVEDTPGAVLQQLGPDEYYVLGDNRDSSFDSRRFGPVKREAIVGRAWFRGWPLNRISKLNQPSYNF